MKWACQKADKRPPTGHRPARLSQIACRTQKSMQGPPSRVLDGFCSCAPEVGIGVWPIQSGEGGTWRQMLTGEAAMVRQQGACFTKRSLAMPRRRVGAREK
jgi:hypothetical protein